MTHYLEMIFFLCTFIRMDYDLKIFRHQIACRDIFYISYHSHKDKDHFCLYSYENKKSLKE